MGQTNMKRTHFEPRVTVLNPKNDDKQYVDFTGYFEIGDTVDVIDEDAAGNIVSTIADNVKVLAIDDSEGFLVLDTVVDTTSATVTAKIRVQEIHDGQEAIDRLYRRQFRGVVLQSDLVDAFVPFGQVVKSGYMGEKGQWSWNQKEETLLFCIASNTWVNLYTLENIIKDNFIKHEETIEMFVPYSKLVSTNYKGIKGQWSYNQNENTLLYCIATNSWVNLYTLENIIKDNFIKHDETIEMFVPISNITSSSAKGIKGQWSFSERHYYKCIATNTWIRHEVEKLF